MTDHRQHHGQSLRRQAEKTVEEQPDDTLLSPADAVRLVHELKVHQIELELQNDELRHAYMDLEVSRTRYRELFDSAPVGYLVLDHDGRIDEINHTATLMLASPRHKLIGKYLNKLCDGRSQDELHILLRRLGKSERAQGSCELAFDRGDAAPLLVQLEARRIDPLQAQGAAIRAVLMDITSTKAAEEELRRKEARFRAIFEHGLMGLALMRPGGELVTANARLLAMLGLENRALHAHLDLLAYFSGRTRNAVRGALLKMEDGVQANLVEQGSWRRPNGELVWINFSISPLPSGDAEAALLLVMTEDVTARKSAEQKLELAANVVTHTSDAVLVTDAQGKIVSANPSFEEISGYSEREVLGRSPFSIESIFQSRLFFRHIRPSLVQDGSWQGEIWRRRKNGEAYLQETCVNVITTPGGEPTHYAVIFSDVSEKAQAKHRLEQLAYYDVLTGLPNRQLFLDRLETALRASRRAPQLLALLFIDLDRFKNINDSLGHRVGDELLQFVARHVDACIRDNDTLARLGGDEFTVILNGIHHAEDAALVCTKILAELNAHPFQCEGNEIFVGASIGVALAPQDAQSSEALIKCADIAMYRAKEAGKNGFRFYASEMNARISEYLPLENDLRKALARNETRLAFQPQVDLASGKVVGVEALMRWHHPKRGTVSPGVFIPLAEDTGLINALGEWVIDTALVHANQWPFALQRDFHIAVNVSGLQLGQRNLDVFVERLVDASARLPCTLELELTESTFMQQADTLCRVFERLRHHDIVIAVDDFGTGYSSLSYLKQLPVDKLKIDHSFIRDMAQDSNEAEITSTIITMAHKLGMRVIAEGVEHRHQLDFLIEQECDEAQGFLFSEARELAHLGPVLSSGFDLASLGHAVRY